MSLNETRVCSKKQRGGGGLGNKLAFVERTEGKQSHNGGIIGHVSPISDFFENLSRAHPRPVAQFSGLLSRN